MTTKQKNTRLKTIIIAAIMCLSMLSALPSFSADEHTTSQGDLLITPPTPLTRGKIIPADGAAPLTPSNALIAGADYLVYAQADATEDNAGNGDPDGDPDDGGWDWVSTSFTHSTSASPTNTYGATVQGLYYAYLETGDSRYFIALTDCANQLITDDYAYRTADDVCFLLRYQDLPGATASVYETSAKAKYDGRIATYGSATDFAEYIRDVRGVTQGYANGIIGWDIGKWAVAADMLNSVFPGNGYDSDADDIAEVLWEDSFNDNPGLFDIIDDQGFDPGYGDVNYYWYTLGISGLIDAFDAAQVHTSEISTLLGILSDCQYPSGAYSFSYGANTYDEDWQSTAYAVMTLAAYDQATYQEEINNAFCWTAATQDPVSGGWVYGSGNHYPETGGENLAALYFADGPVKNIDTGEIFCSIQAAIDDAETLDGHTIEISAGTYDEAVTVDKQLTLIGAGIGQTFVKSTSSPVITIAEDFVTIEDLTITDDLELVQGMRIASPASTGLTLERVAFEKLGAGTGSNAYGIFIAPSFTGLSVLDCEFSSAPHTTYYRTIGIFSPNHLNHQDFEIAGSTFTTMWTSIYIRSAIDGLLVHDNIFTPVQSSDFGACVAGLYIGDGDDGNFDLENIEVYQNTFTDYGRGVYVWNYGANSVIDNFRIHDNVFENSQWSSAIRFIIGLNGFEDYTIAGITIDNNEFTQNTDVGANVALVDFRTYDATLLSCNILVDNNEMTFSGGPYVDAMYGVKISPYGSPFTNTIVSNNNIDGGLTAGVGTVPSSGVLIDHYASGYWPASILDVDIVGNGIAGFDHGISVFDQIAADYGGLPTGCLVDVNCNDIVGNTLYGIISGVGETINAECNWWGDVSGPSGVGPGLGDAVSVNVDYDPWLGLVIADAGGPYDNTADYESYTIQFDGSASYANTCCGGETLSYLWNFGDGETSTEMSPAHTYDDWGTYYVTLTVTGNTYGAVDVDTTTAKVYGMSVDAGGPYEGIAGVPLTLTAAAAGGLQPYTYTWDLGDGTTMTGRIITHTYTTEGTYDISLYVEDQYGIYAEDFTTALIHPSGSMVADAGGPYSSQVDIPIQFAGSVQGGTAPYTWSWDFGDGATSTEQNPTHAYSALGTYTATLTVMDSLGQTDSDTATVNIIEVTNHEPNIPNIDGPTEGKYNVEYTFNFSAYDADGDDVKFIIKWGDDNDPEETIYVASGETIQVTHTWEKENYDGETVDTAYLLEAKAVDTHGAQGEWGSMDVTMPYTLLDMVYNFVYRLMDQYPLFDWFFSLPMFNGLFA